MWGGRPGCIHTDRARTPSHTFWVARNDPAVISLPTRWASLDPDRWTRSSLPRWCVFLYLTVKYLTTLSWSFLALSLWSSKSLSSSCSMTIFSFLTTLLLVLELSCWFLRCHGRAFRRNLPYLLVSYSYCLFNYHSRATWRVVQYTFMSHAWWPWTACRLRRLCLEVLWLLFFLSHASTGTMASKALTVLESYVFKQGPIISIGHSSFPPFVCVQTSQDASFFSSHHFTTPSLS